MKYYENAQLADTEGSWEAGVDGALPGIVMFGDPSAHIGETYRQEYYAGEAEDMGQLLTVTAQTVVPYGEFENVVLNYDFTPLEIDAHEIKYYAEGIGVVKELDLVTGAESVLIEFSAP